jgi:hypothetical protein
LCIFYQPLTIVSQPRGKSKTDMKKIRAEMKKTVPAKKFAPAKKPAPRAATYEIWQTAEIYD